MKGYDSFAETPPRKTVMKSLPETPYSVLDLSPIRRGGSAAELVSGVLAATAAFAAGADQSDDITCLALVFRP